MKRQSPFASLMETPVKARVAVVSKAWEAATSDGTRFPPARETGTGVVGLASTGGAADVMAAALALEAAVTESVDSISVTGGVVLDSAVVVIRRVTVTIKVETPEHRGSSEETITAVEVTLAMMAVDEAAEDGVEEAESEVVTTEEALETAAPDEPNVNDCVEPTGLQEPASITFSAVTTRQMSGDPTGENSSGPFPPAKGNN